MRSPTASRRCAGVHVYGDGHVGARRLLRRTRGQGLAQRCRRGTCAPSAARHGNNWARLGWRGAMDASAQWLLALVLEEACYNEPKHHIMMFWCVPKRGSHTYPGRALHNPTSDQGSRADALPPVTVRKAIVLRPQGMIPWLEFHIELSIDEPLQDQTGHRRPPLACASFPPTTRGCLPREARLVDGKGVGNQRATP